MNWLGAGTRGEFFRPTGLRPAEHDRGMAFTDSRACFFHFIFLFNCFWESVPSSSIVKTPPLPDGRGRGVADNHLIFNAVVFVEHHAFTQLVCRRF